MNGQEPADPAIIVGQKPDGNPVPDYTAQERCLAYIHSNLVSLFAAKPDVTVSMRCPWYPRPDSDVCQTPGVSVIFGRPERPRDVYRQWEEGDVPMQVVFDVFPDEMLHRDKGHKFLFYNDLVEEYYTFDLADHSFTAFTRSPMRRALVKVRDLYAFASPRMGIRFEQREKEVVIQRPERSPFGTLADALNQRDEARRMMQRIALLSRRVLWKEATQHDRAELERLILRSEYL